MSLLQFAWRGAAGVNGAFAAASAAAGDVTAASDQDVSGAAAHGGRAGGSPRAASEAFGAGSGSGDSDGVGLRRLALNDQLLGKSRLLRRFLSQSLEVMEVRMGVMGRGRAAGRDGAGRGGAGGVADTSPN